MDDLKFNGIREGLSFLLKDEISAVEGYDRVLAECTDLPDEFRVQLERIRNTEIDHIKDLSNMFQHYSTEKIVGKDSWTMHKGVDGLYYFQNQRGESYVHDSKVVKYADARQAGEFFITSLYTADSGIVPKIIVDEEKNLPRVVKEEHGYSIQDGDFFIQYRPQRDVKFALALRQDRTVFDSESEALRVRKEFMNL